MFPSAARLLLVSALTSSSLAACRGPDRASSEHVDPAQPFGAAERVGYAPGPWWRGDINDTLVGVAHILIRHSGSEQQERLTWVPPQQSSRSREEALRLAAQLRQQLRAHPERFGELATKHSEDAATAPLQGEIGAVYVPHLPGSMVDALGNLDVGAVSRVVESKLGFHIVKRLAVPAEQTLAGREIVIGYDTTSPFLRPGRVVARSRDEAAALAARIAGELQKDPTGFELAIEKHSDAASAVYGGDYGAWSSYDRGGDPLRLGALARLSEGGVSPPVETRQGISILQRTAPTRARTAVKLLALGFDEPGETGHGRSREQALTLAAQIQRTLARRPERFASLREQHCDFDYCHLGVSFAEQGRGPLGQLADASHAAKPGALFPHWIELSDRLVFAQHARADEAPEPSRPTPSFELPRPAALTLESATPAQLAWFIRYLHQLAAPQLNLDPQESQRFQQLMEQLASGLASAPADAREKLRRESTLALDTLLGPERATRLGEIHAAVLARTLGALDR